MFQELRIMKIKLSQRKVHLEERLDMRELCSRAALLFLPPVTAFYLMQFVYGAWPWQTEILAAAANILCIAAVYFLLCALTGYPAVCCVLLHVIFGIWGAVNYFVSVYRGTPVLPWDFTVLRTAFAVSGTYRFIPTWRMTASIVFVGLLAWGLRKRMMSGQLIPGFRAAVARIMVLAAGVFCLGPVVRPERLTAFGIETDVWNQTEAYNLLGLRYQDGHYDLVKLNDEEYQEKLQIQSDYWDKLKTEIRAVRNKGYENTDIVNMSEIYFTMADETVSAAESYSEKIAIKIRTIELLSALDMLSLVILVIMQTLRAMQMAMQNRLLEQKVFIDAHTGLPNKNACNELLNKKDIITDPTACIMFDLNNLKIVNDTMGHSAGDQLIMNFAKLLRSVIPEKDFVGRYGGDEFIAVVYHTSEAEIKEILKSLYGEKDRLNSYENQIPIDYACGWALSSGDMSCTMQMLLDDADAYMYKNKQLCKKYN